MSTITTRYNKGAPLTNSEIDANFTNLNTDKLEKAGGAVTGALSVAGALTANGAVSANAGLTATKSYSVTSAGSVPALVTWGSFGGGLALQDGAAYAGLYTSALGADLHVYTGVTESDTAVSKVRLSILGASGNTGFGTPAPTAALHAYRSTAVEVSAMAQNSAGYAKYGVDTSGVGQLVAGSWNVYANTTTLAVAVDTSGRVAINRNSASFSTGTARTAIAYPGNTDWALGLRDTSAQSTVYPIVFLNSSEGIAGSVAMTATSTSYNTSSDERLKENIEDAADPGAVIDAIQIRQFDWIATGEHQDYGVVAQELEQVYPPAVPEATVGPDGEEMYRGVDYSKLVPLLVKEVQLLRARVAQLEGGSQ